MRRLVLASLSSSRNRRSGRDHPRDEGRPRPHPRRGELRWPKEREHRRRDHEGSGDRQEHVPRRPGVRGEPAGDRQREARHGGDRGDHRPLRRPAPCPEGLGPGPEPAPRKDRRQHGDREGDARQRAGGGPGFDRCGLRRNRVRSERRREALHTEGPPSHGDRAGEAHPPAAAVAASHAQARRVKAAALGSFARALLARHVRRVPPPSRGQAC